MVLFNEITRNPLKSKICYQKNNAISFWIVLNRDRASFLGVGNNLRTNKRFNVKHYLTLALSLSQLLNGKRRPILWSLINYLL